MLELNEYCIVLYCISLSILNIKFSSIQGLSLTIHLLLIFSLVCCRLYTGTTTESKYGWIIMNANNSYCTEWKIRAYDRPDVVWTRTAGGAECRLEGSSHEAAAAAALLGCSPGGDHLRHAAPGCSVARGTSVTARRAPAARC